MTKEELQKRTKAFTVGMILFCESLERGMVNYEISKQIVRASMSITANYRAACRAKSIKDFLNKLKIVEEETDEVKTFLEIMEDLNRGDAEKRKTLYAENKELLAIFTAAIKTTREKLNDKGKGNL